MKTTFSIALIAGLLFAQSALSQPATADRTNSADTAAPRATTSPLLPIYRVTGLRDTGSLGNVGVATSFHCTSLSTVGELLSVRVFKYDGTLLRAVTYTLTRFRTFTLSTHATVLFTEDGTLTPGQIIDQGYAIIYATTLSMICTAMIVDAASAVPNGISLHMVRFNPLANTLE